MNRRLSNTLLVLIGVTLNGVARAQTPAYSFTSAPTSNDTYLNLGIILTANTNVTVSALGYYDYWFTNQGQTSGLKAQHNVGIYDNNGSLLTSTVVDAGAADPLIGDFRYKPIAPFTLLAGQTYVLDATTDRYQDPWAYGVAGSSITGFNTLASITISHARYLYQSDNVLRFPEDESGYTIYAGPNFLVGSISTNVPEPGASAVLAGIGVASTGIWLRRRRG